MNKLKIILITLPGFILINLVIFLIKNLIDNYRYAKMDIETRRMVLLGIPTKAARKRKLIVKQQLSELLESMGYKETSRWNAKEDEDKLLSSYVSKQKKIVDEFLSKKKENTNSSLRLLLIAATIYCYACILFDIEMKIEVILLLCMLIVFTLLSQALIRFRIKKGYYGSDYEEAKELLFFLIENIDKNDKDSGKKIFDELDEYSKEAAESKAKVVGDLQY